VAYTHSTELVYFDGGRKAQMIPMVDHASRLALASPVGERALMGLALEAWDQAKETLKAQGAEPNEMIFVSDQDPVFTS
jgi:hypothetical protein